MKIHEDYFIKFHLCEWKELRETENWITHNKNQEKEKLIFKHIIKIEGIKAKDECFIWYPVL